MLCFIVRIEITGNLIFQALNLFFSGLCTIFFGGVTSVKKKTRFKFWGPISREPNILENQEKAN